MNETIYIGNGVQIVLKRSARTRRLTLRVPKLGGDPVLTLPTGTKLADARAFAESHIGWLQGAVERQVDPRRVAEGSRLPIAGQTLIITPAPIRSTRIQGDQLLVPANKPVGASVASFLKFRALEALKPACDRYAAQLGRPFRAIALRDTRSRWGSCSADGRLMFSWRLAMAPSEVLAYVAAHEVAHLAHMDHSARFWAQVGAIMPDYQHHRDWLRLHGNELLSWRFKD